MIRKKKQPPNLFRRWSGSNGWKRTFNIEIVCFL